MDKTVLTLGVDSSQVGTASIAFKQMVTAGNTAAAASAKVTNSAKEQAKALAQIPAAVNKSKVALTDLAAAAGKVSPNAVVQVTAALAKAENQANRTAAAVTAMSRATNATPNTPFAGNTSPSARTPLATPSPFNATTRLNAPVASVSLLAGEAGKAQRAVDKLTSSAKTQRSALAQLAPAAATTAASYRELAASPITLAAPQGLQAAASALASVVASISAAKAPNNAGAARQNTVAAAAARELAEGNKAIGASARLAAFQQQQLAFQLNDFFVQVSSGQSALVALIQQGSQLSGTYGGIGNALRAVVAQITPTRLAIAGTAGAVAVLGNAFFQGSRQSKAFADSIALTGNFAGQTEGKINALARTVSASGQVSIAAARQAAQALLSTGEIGPQVFAVATEAAALYAEATGKTAEEVAKDFASMARAPTKFAAEANRSLNFITAAEYDAIKAFEENGMAADAQGVIYDALNRRLKALDPNFGIIERSLRSAKNAWASFWDAAYDIGRANTIEQQLQSTAIRADMFAKEQAKLKGIPGLGQGKKPATPGEGPADRAAAERRELNRKLFRQGENAAGEALRAEVNKSAIAAKAVIEGYVKRGKAADQYKEKLAELNRGFKDNENAGTPVSAADKKTSLAVLKKDFAGSKSGGGEASQVLRAQLDADIRGFQDVLDQERDAFAFHNRFLQGEYQAGSVSLKSFYDDKRETTARAVTAEIAELEQERLRLEQFKKATKDPSEKLGTQTKIDENLALQGKVRANASRDIELSNQDEAASFKALSDQVTNYRANLLQMQGDEAGAARLRAASTITAAQVLSKQAGNGVDVGALARAIDITDQFNEVQRQAAILTANAARAEEAYGLVAEQAGKSLIESERGVFAIRSEELKQLGALAAKARELADASTDPRIKSFASDLALEYAKAANAIDPALQRLRDANKELAAGLAGTVGDAPNAFVQEYAQRRATASADVKSQRETYDRKIDLLEGYLATTFDKNDKARLREKIKEAEAQRDGVKGESRGRSILGAISKSVIEPMSQQIFATVNKLLITDPLQKYLEGQLKGLTEGDGLLAGVFKDALGVQGDPKEAALALQTAAVTSSTSALDLLTQAAQNAANAIAQPVPSPGQGTIPSIGTPEGEAADVQAQANQTIKEFGQTTASVTADLSALSVAANSGGGAMARLPAIISLIQSAAAALSGGGGSGSGGFWGSIIGAIAGSGEGGGDGGGSINSPVFHTGGIVGAGGASRSIAARAFAGAPRYHTGGIVGNQSDKLRANEVAAILMGGPKGKREEVLHADDPRHRDNLGLNALAKIMAESKHAGMRVRGARALGGPVSPNSMYRVNEKGPELLQVAGKQYLMTGAQGGAVHANNGGGKPSQNIQVHVNVTPPPGASAASANQFGAAAGRRITNALRRNG